MDFIPDNMATFHYDPSLLPCGTWQGQLNNSPGWDLGRVYNWDVTVDNAPIHQSITMYHSCQAGHDRDSWLTALVRILARFICGMWQLIICHPFLTMYHICHVGHDRDSWLIVLVMIQAAHTNGMWQLTVHYPSITQYSRHVDITGEAGQLSWLW